MSTIHMTVAGRLATSPERRVSENGTRVSFRVASTERRYNRADDAWIDGETVYLTVVCWRQLAENVHTSLRVGDPVLVHGKLLSRSFERDGRPQTFLEIAADAVGPDLRWCTTAVTRTRSAAAESPVGPVAEESSVLGPEGEEQTPPVHRTVPAAPTREPVGAGSGVGGGGPAVEGGVRA